MPATIPITTDDPLSIHIIFCWTILMTAYWYMLFACSIKMGMINWLALYIILI